MPITIREAFASVHSLDLLSIALPIFLAVVGVYVSIYPLNTNTKKRFGAALFVFVGVASVFLMLWQLGEARVEAQRALDQTTGGNAYCFFIAMQPSIYSPGEKWKLRAENDGQTPVLDVKADLREHLTATDSEDEINRKISSPMRMNVGTVPKGGILTDYEILPGFYQVDIYSRNDSFIETIEIYPSEEPNALHKWHVFYEVTHSPDGRLVRPRVSQ